MREPFGLKRAPLNFPLKFLLTSGRFGSLDSGGIRGLFQLYEIRFGSSNRSSQLHSSLASQRRRHGKRAGL